MNVQVKQSIITLLGRKYTVAVDYQKEYIIRRKFLSFPAEYEIKDAESKEVIGSISNKNFLKANATIRIGSSEYDFKQEAFNTMTYHCISKRNSDKYLIQGHQGYSFSAFKNSDKIAFVTRDSFEILEGNKYQVHQNFDEDPILVSAFIVLVDTFRFSIRIGGDIGWDVGNIGDGLTYYDEDWKPKLR